MSARTMMVGQKAPIVANEVYNVLSSLTDKLEGLAAYDKYEHDGHDNDAIWNELRTHDEQAVRMLMAQVERFVKEGKFHVNA
jgi:hypothetical protein